jgi:purine-nucleoside phosphorylase
LRKRAGGALDLAVVLGSGLSEAVVARLDGAALPYAKLDGAPTPALAGHPGTAHLGMWGERRVVAFAGRAHLYQGFGPRAVTYFIRLAAAAGARTLVLTNAAGGLDPSFVPGDLMLISDQLNLTASSPLDGSDATHPFVDMNEAYSPSLRAHARSVAAERGIALREGVYAGVRGPQFETPAEIRMLRGLGADAVGMSTVLETIAARALGLEVLGISLISNTTGGHVSHEDVLRVSQEGSERLAILLEAL